MDVQRNAWPALSKLDFPIEESECAPVIYTQCKHIYCVVLHQKCKKPNKSIAIKSRRATVAHLKLANISTWKGHCNEINETKSK